MSKESFSFAEHLQELRSRLKVVFLALFIILVIVIFAPSNPVYQFEHPGQYLNLQFLEHTVVATFLHQVTSYLLPANWGLIAANGIGEGMEVYFIASLILSLAIAMPIIAYETYKFVDPALNEREKGMVYPFVTSASILFVVGILFGYFVIAKFLVVALAPFFVSTGIQPQVDAFSFYSVVFLIIGSTGVSFTAPVFVYALIRLRVLDADFFSQNRVIIWFLIWVVTGLFLTPDGGPLLDVVIFVPIVAMVEAAVWLGRRSLRGVPIAPSLPPDRCRYCAEKLVPGRAFCPNCGRSSV